MKRIGMEELKKLQLDILEKVHNFCVNNHIDYTLSSGTLIGAIRHKGYIPWDDDIDIEMTRPNYNKFIKSFNGTYQELEVLCPELDWGYYAPYANVCDNRTILIEGDNGHNGRNVGVKIDIFPIDGLPSDEKGCKSIFEKVSIYNTFMRYKRYPISYFHKGNIVKRFIKRCAWYFLHLVPYSFFQKRLHKIATFYDFETARNVGPILFMNSKCSINKDTFSKYQETEFEGKKFKIIQDYDVYLKALYGDYMQLPPEEKRIAHHNFVAYWID